MTYKLCEFWGPWLPTILSIIGAIIAIWQAIIAKKANKTQVFIERRQSIQKIYEEIWQWAEDIEHNPSTDDKCIYAMEKNVLFSFKQRN